MSEDVTTKGKLLKYCTDRGMFDSQAKTVVDLAIEEIDTSGGEYKTTWDRPANEYPDEVIAVMLMILKRTALKWIDENKPKAFFRPMFL